MNDSQYYEAELIKMTEALLRARQLLVRSLPFVELHENLSANSFGGGARALQTDIKIYLGFED